MEKKQYKNKICKGNEIMKMRRNKKTNKNRGNEMKSDIYKTNNIDEPLP